MNAISRSTGRAHHAAAIERDPRWASVVARNREADGSFWYSVATTGVYCRPSCAARQARPENVRFHLTREEAENAGFRPCRRCRPDAASPQELLATRIADVCRLIDAAEEPPALEDLARHAAMSVFHFHRSFKRVTGVTPKAYAAAGRARRLREGLGNAGSVTAAIFDAGYNSSGRFYEQADAELGMTPTDYRAGGASMSIRHATGRCSLGLLLIARSERGICSILLGDDAEELVAGLRAHFPRASLIAADAGLAVELAAVIRHVDQPAAAFDLPLDIRGTAFQRRVWQALRDVPPGSTASYAAIASRIGAPHAARAVAQACAANKLAVAVPCHRIVRQDGELAGYRWGVARKRELLRREAGR